jgi:hypothetical protein
MLDTRSAGGEEEGNGEAMVENVAVEAGFT